MATQVAIPTAATHPAHWRAEQPWRHGVDLLKVRSQKQARKASGPDERELGELIVSLLPLVRRVAMPMRERLPAHVELDDLLSTGVLGLVDAIQKFDPTKQVKLEQYAQYRIRGAILDGLRELDPASRDMRRKNKNAERIYSDLESKLGRPPNDQEMAKALGISLSRWYRTLSELRSLGLEWLRPLASLSSREAAPAHEDGLPADNEGHQFDACYLHERRRIMRRALGRISDRERQVIELYYHHELTMREIGDRLGIGESRVSQLHSSALEHLRRRVQASLSAPVPATQQLAW